MSENTYMLAGQPSELDRLQLQSLVWESSGRRLLSEIGEGAGLKALDVGCGALGWLRLLSHWVGPTGVVVGTDIDPAMLAAADRFAGPEELSNVTVVHDDLFASALEPATFDLVHSRFQLAPLGRGPEQMASLMRLVRPGGIVVTEEVDPASWHFVPAAPATERLKPLIGEAIRVAGGIPDPPATQLDLFHQAGITPNVRLEVQALPPGHPYQQLPLQFAAGLHQLLESIVDAQELAQLVAEAESELQDPGRWGITFTLFQCWGRRLA
jgi:ubiquinone/menaquinone biosynthesis C-methylase UbiE